MLSAGELLKQQKVLYVEDEEIARQSIGIFLRRHVGELLLAANGSDGLARYQENRPGIVITDLEMPIMNGMEMIRRIRERDQSVPIIITTAYDDEAHQCPDADRVILKPVLFSDLLQGYFSYTPTEEQLEQAKSWYAQMMDSAEKGKAYDQAIMPIQMVSQAPYFQREVRRALLPSITLKEVLDYRANLKTRGRPELMVIGNMTADAATTLARQIQQQLGADGNEWCRNKDVVVNRQQLAIFNKTGNSTDSALAAVFAPPNVDEFSSTAASTLLGQIIQPWFYNQLRTEEQLGYAVFAFPMNVGRQWGMGFLLQSSDKQPAFLWQRFQAFFPTAEAKLRAMKPEEFAQLQQAVISQMLQAPQTLGDEASKLSKDFDRGNMRFDSRDKVVAQIKLLTPQKLADFFHQTVVEPQGMTILSQISGSQNGKADYAQPAGGKVWENVSALQQSLPLMRENE